MGTQTQTTIEINGKRYDARTGQLITNQQSHAQPTNQPANRNHRAVTRTHHTNVQAVHKPAEKSKTLMRHAVKKPVQKPVQPNNTIRTMSDISRKPQPMTNQTTNFKHQSDKDRLERANQVQRSALVSKFNDFMSKPSGTAAGVNHAPRHEVKSAPLPVQAAPTHVQHHETTQRVSKAESMLAKGLQAAQSHNEDVVPIKRSKRAKRSRLATMSAGGMAVLLLLAFFAYQNVPNVAIRYAAARAGVSAQLPGYRPAGFALDSRIHYTPGQITVKFASNTDDRNFSITERTSNWNSEALMSNYVATTSDQVQSYEDKGRTIYLYGESNATWVNGGIWYEINGNSQLTSDQLIRIATSI